MNIKIKDLRLAAGLSQTKVAMAAGITVAGYCNLESGRSQLSESKFSTVKKLADVLGDQVYEIAKEETEKKSL